MKDLKNLYPDRDKDSYAWLQNCATASGINLDILEELGVTADISVCPYGIFWYQKGVDYTVIEKSTDNIVVSNEEDESANVAYTVYNPGKIEHKRTITIKPEFGGRLWQRLQEIQIQDSQGGFDGRLFQAYAKSGFHMRTTVTDEINGITIEEVCIEVFCPIFPDTMFQDFTNTEDGVEMEFYIQQSPEYSFTGSKLASYMYPQSFDEETPYPDITNLAITSGATGSSIEASIMYKDWFIPAEEIMHIKIIEKNVNNVVTGEKVLRVNNVPTAGGTETISLYPSNSSAPKNMSVYVGYKFSDSGEVFYISEADYYNIHGTSTLIEDGDEDIVYVRRNADLEDELKSPLLEDVVYAKSEEYKEEVKKENNEE